MRRIAAFLALIVTAHLITTPSIAKNEDSTQTIQVYQHNYETKTTELVTMEIPTNAAGEAYDVGDSPISPYAIIGGTDSRTRITTVTSNPYNKILCLEIKFDANDDGIADYNGSGTGFFSRH